MWNEYVTPEGFTLSRPLLLPDVRTFGEVLTYVREWDYATMSHRNGEVARPDLVPAPRMIGENEIGPYCSINANGERYRGVAVIARDEVLEVVAPRIVTPDDRLSFKVIEHVDNGRALVILEHNHIIGSHWLAYIDPASIPARPTTEG